MKLILASQSPRRKELLGKLGVEFEVITSKVQEDWTESEPGQVVEELALAKAKDVAGGCSEGLVLGADTIVVLEGTILGKPKSNLEAEQMLQQLSGRKHRVFTGIALVDAATGVARTDHEVTWVQFRELTAQEIKGYVKTGEPLDKAGAYGIQGRGAILVLSIEGCYTNIVGLPLTKLYFMLKEFGVEIFEQER